MFRINRLLDYLDAILDVLHERLTSFERSIDKNEYLANAPDDDIKSFIIEHIEKRKSVVHIDSILVDELKLWHLRDFPYEFKLVDFVLVVLKILKNKKSKVVEMEDLENIINSISNVKHIYFALTLRQKDTAKYIKEISNAGYYESYMKYIGKVRAEMLDDDKFTVEGVREDLFYCCRCVLDDVALCNEGRK